MEPTLTAAATSTVRIAIVGGGLAGLAAAVALSDSRRQRESSGARLAIEVFESRRMLGGRATSYRDPETGELVDNCQHVSLGCCTNFEDFCRRSGVEHLFVREAALHFIGPNGRACTIKRSKWLPAPLHLAPSLLRLSYLTWRERLAVATALRRLARRSFGDSQNVLMFGEWLRQVGQSERAIALFWSPVIISALSEEVDRSSFAVARKVFVDAFLRHARGYEMTVPQVPLRTLYDEHLAPWLQQRGVKIHSGSEVRRIEIDGELARSVVLADGGRRQFDMFCVTTPWYRIRELFDNSDRKRLPFLDAVEHFHESPITSVHLWCTKKLRLPYRHAVLPGRLSQWLFDRTKDDSSPYYQVVISASREIASMTRGEVIARVCRDLEETFGAPICNSIARSKVITEQRAVFSPTPDAEKHRPSQRTPIPNLFLAGDWTATGWPATMEGAVRSGYRAVEAILEQLGAKELIVVPDLPSAPLARWLLGIR